MNFYNIMIGMILAWELVHEIKSLIDGKRLKELEKRVEQLDNK